MDYSCWLTDMSEQEILSNFWSNLNCVKYRIFKNEILFEKYLVNLNRRDAIILCRFRYRSHRLPINNGRFESNPEESKVVFPWCGLKVFGEKFHYIFVCRFFKKGRQICLDRQFIVSSLSTFHMKNSFNGSSVKVVTQKLSRQLIIMEKLYMDGKQFS